MPTRDRHPFNPIDWPSEVRGGGDEERFERLAALIGQMGIGVISTDVDGRTIFLNSAAEEATGYSTAEAVGNPIDGVLKPADRTGQSTEELGIHRPLRRANGEVVPVLTSFRTKSGQVRLVESAMEPIRDGAITVFRDASGSEGPERSPFLNEFWFCLLTDARNSLIWFSPVPETREYLTRSSGNFDDFPALESPERWVDHVHPEDLPGYQVKLRDAFATNEPFEAEYRFRRRDGRYRWILERGTACFDSKKVFLGFIGTGSDITGQKEEALRMEHLAERSRNQSRRFQGVISRLTAENAELDLQIRQTKRTSSSRHSYLMHLSHELRTPLNSISGFATLLAEETAGELNEKQKRYVRNVQLGARHLIDLLNNTLEMFRAESGYLELHREWVDVHEVAGEVMSGLMQVASAKRLSLQNEVGAGLQLFVDRVRFHQVLYNLVHNAIKFSHKGTVSVKSLEHPAFVQLSVEDSGIGIAADQLSSIFDEFAQAAPTGSSGDSTGSGLGLAIARQLVECHGGTIWVESELGRGSTFIVRFPLGDLHETDCTPR